MGEEMLSLQQHRIIKDAKLTYSPLVKAFRKQIKTIEEQGEKQRKVIEGSRKDQLVALNENIKKKMTMMMFFWL